MIESVIGLKAEGHRAPPSLRASAAVPHTLNHVYIIFMDPLADQKRATLVITVRPLTALLGRTGTEGWGFRID